MKRVTLLLLGLPFLCVYGNIFGQRKQPVKTTTSYLFRAIGLSEKEIIKHYQDGTNRFKIEEKYDEQGLKMAVIHHHSLSLNYYINSDTCFLLKVFPGTAAESLSKLNDSLNPKIGDNRWIIQFNPTLYMNKLVDSNGDFFIVYNDGFLNYVKKFESSSTDSHADTIQMPIYGDDEFYDGYQIADFARQVGFKPKNYTFKDWETAVIKVFANGQGGYANSRQINIDAMYLCNRQSDVMYRRYIQLYGSISRSTFDRYCRLFIILLKTDGLSR